LRAQGILSEEETVAMTSSSAPGLETTAITPPLAAVPPPADQRAA
jgi:hypothetical protein